jgi:hypothetical protein
MLSENSLVLVWLIGGEKTIVNRKNIMLAERMVYNSMLWTTGDGKIESIDRQNMA